MSSAELEKYIKPDSRFMPQAIEYAFEILEARGRVFSPEEVEKKNTLIAEKQNNTEVMIHPYHTKAANLIYLSGALAIANIIWTYESLTSAMAVFIVLITLSFIFGMGYLAGKGTDWVKYVLLVILGLGLFALPIMLMTLRSNPVLGVINITQTALQIWAVIVLFKVPKTVHDQSKA